MIDRGLLIGGKEVEAADGATLEVINPATGALIARVAAAGEPDIDSAVTVALETFDSGVWSQMPIWDRAKVLNPGAGSGKAGSDGKAGRSRSTSSPTSGL